jgi:hypothetical protein
MSASKHVGKSSAGWCFSLHVYPEEGIHDLADWRKILHTGTICDEYGDGVSPKEMLSIITERTWVTPNRWSAIDYESNNGEPGPNGLVRHRIGGGCIAHGEGTWDCIVGEFS